MRARKYRHINAAAWAVLLGLFVGVSVSGAAQLSSAAGPAHLWGERPDGSPVASLRGKDDRAVVLFFVASDCPVSNRLFPEMVRLRQRFAAQGVAAWYVYPNAGESLDGVAAHQRSFDPAGQAIIDADGSLVRLAHAVATPELAVLLPTASGFRTTYAGKLTDQYIHLGVERPAPTRFYGEEAIAAALTGKAPPVADGPPVGCAIVPRRGGAPVQRGSAP